MANALQAKDIFLQALEKESAMERQQYLADACGDDADLRRRVDALLAAQIVQEICIGLAAAHAKGVLHRDLKPANIMIDGQGQVRITDFGLASVSLGGESVVGMSGTPASMAPEQLLRGQSSIQSDIYSLGLIVYELFSGEPVHQATSVGDLRQIHSDSSRAKNLSEVINDIDPAVARVVDRCLSSDLETNRPATAHCNPSELMCTLVKTVLTNLAMLTNDFNTAEYQGSCHASGKGRMFRRLRL